MNKTTNRWMVLSAMAVFLACASTNQNNPNTPGKRTAIGAGAAVGAGVGAVAGGWKGAAIGAAAGAAAGGGVGYYLDRQAAELKQVAQTRRTDEGVLVSLKNDLLFDTNSSILKPSAIDEITKVGDILAKYPEDRIKVEGFTDSTGSQGYNEELSLRRAEAVKNVLISRGVKEEQILVLGLGPTQPVADNHSAQGRSKNRRVELHIDVPQASSS